MRFRRRLSAAALAVLIPAATETMFAQSMKSMPGMPGMHGMHDFEHDSAASPPAEAPAPAAKLQVYRDRGDIVFDLGPIELPAHAMHDMVRQPRPAVGMFGADGWIHGYELECVDSAGRAVPHSVVHHIVVYDPAKRELFSPLMLRLAAAGAETPAVALPRVLGLRVQPGDSVIVTAMVDNPTARAYHGVHLRLRFRFTRGSSWIPTMPVYPFWLDVTPPTGDHSFDLPPGRSEHHWEGRPAIAGRILGLTGHLHRYGALLQLEDRTAHRVLWSVKPDTDANGDIKDIPVTNFILHLGVPVYPDHVYRLTAVYDNTSGRTITDDAMGVVGGVVLPTGGAWPNVDPADPGYQFDVKSTWSDTMTTMHMPPAPRPVPTPASNLASTPPPAPMK